MNSFRCQHPVLWFFLAIFLALHMKANSQQGNIFATIELLSKNHDLNQQYSIAGEFIQNAKADELIKFIRAIGNIDSRDGRVAALRALKRASDLRLNSRDIFALCRDTDALVRIAAADLLPDTEPWLSKKIEVLVASLGTEEPDVAGDPPPSTHMISETIMMKLPRTQTVRKALYSSVPTVENRVFFHLVDLLRFRELNDNESPSIYYYNGDVLPKDAEILRSWWNSNRPKKSTRLGNRIANGIAA